MDLEKDEKSFYKIQEKILKNIVNLENLLKKEEKVLTNACVKIVGNSKMPKHFKNCKVGKKGIIQPNIS